MEGGYHKKDEREKGERERGGGGRDRIISNIITYKYGYIQIVLQGSMAGIFIMYAERIRGYGHLLTFCVRSLVKGIQND